MALAPPSFRLAAALLEIPLHREPCPHLGRHVSRVENGRFIGRVASMIILAVMLFGVAAIFDH
jgi:hypothetical protein